MREFKFRVFNTRRKELEECFDLYWFEENGVHENGDNDSIIQQYTGLKDGNGVEIFEGDILDFDPIMFPDDTKNPYEIVFEDGSFRGKLVNGKWPKDLPYPIVDQYSIKLLNDKIIGNNYEERDK